MELIGFQFSNTVAEINSVRVIHVFRSGDTFAEGALMSEGYPADAIALEPTNLLHLCRGGYVK